jgi:hypothetical protein
MIEVCCRRLEPDPTASIADASVSVTVTQCERAHHASARGRVISSIATRTLGVPMRYFMLAALGLAIAAPAYAAEDCHLEKHGAAYNLICKVPPNLSRGRHKQPDIYHGGNTGIVPPHLQDGPRRDEHPELVNPIATVK